MREPLAKLRNDGVVLLQGSFSLEPLMRLRNAAALCFHAIESGLPLPQPRRYNPLAHSVQITALLDFGIDSETSLLVPLSAPALDDDVSRSHRGSLAMPPRALVGAKEVRPAQRAARRLPPSGLASGRGLGSAISY